MRCSRSFSVMRALKRVARVACHTGHAAGGAEPRVTSIITGFFHREEDDKAEKAKGAAPGQCGPQEGDIVMIQVVRSSYRAHDEETKN